MCPLPKTMSKAEETQLLFFINSGVTNSFELANQWAKLQKRLPSPTQHAEMMKMLSYLEASGLIDGQTALDKAKYDVYFQLALTEKGEGNLFRGTHRFWLASLIWEQCMDFGARVLAYFANPQ
jgi:hypothetical protein